MGAGLGGLCLAQGLRRQGVEVTVFERDDALLTRSQVYRLYIDPDETPISVDRLTLRQILFEGQREGPAGLPSPLPVGAGVAGMGGGGAG
ncbi:NAD(P)-binding protein [Streptomyces sp. NPDC059761]|uniref:NAD(P)-binding protein n=1 Tax=Streptomyces sp. NPDC059761 TaxID=3346937 RepID=UPI003668B276